MFQAHLLGWFLDDFLMVQQLNPKANVELRTQVEVVEPLAGSKITWDPWVPWIPWDLFCVSWLEKKRPGFDFFKAAIVGKSRKSLDL
jgi:hypothetical protein